MGPIPVRWPLPLFRDWAPRGGRGALAGPCILLIPLALGPLWFSAKVAHPSPLLPQPPPELGALPFFSAPSNQRGGPACTGSGQPAQPWGPQPPLPHALCLQSLLPLAGASDHLSFAEHHHPSRSAPEVLGPGWGCPTDAGVVPWRGRGHTQSKAKPGLAVDPASRAVHSRSCVASP